MTKQLFFLMESCKKTSVTRSTYYEVADCGHVIWIIQMFKCSFYNFLELMNKHVISSQHIPTATSASIVFTLTFTCISIELLPSTKIMIYLKFNRNNLWQSSFNDITDGGPLLLQNWNLLRVFKISTTEADFELKAKLITILLISWFHDLMFHWFFQLNRHNLGCTNSFKGTITLCKSKHL